MSYLVHLQQFEGPLGLLLYLIRKEEMDIFDINVNDITRQYLDYIRMMKELDLEVAGEFVAMAATLIHIKSRMLLPQYDEQGEVVEQIEDPRKELVQKLLEYQRYQEGAKKLYDRPLLNRDIFVRGVREDLRLDGDIGEVITEDEGLFSLIASYRRIVRKAQRAVHKVRPKVQSIASRVLELKDRLRVGTRVILRELLIGDSGAKRTQLLITFLSMLELGRMGFVSIFQNEVYGDIYIDPKRPIEGNVLERVQEFDSGDAEAVAKSIINEAMEEKIDMAEAMAAEEAAAVEAAAAGSGDAQLSLIGPDSIPVHEFSSEDMGFVGGELEGDIATDDEILEAERELANAPASSDAAPAGEAWDAQALTDEPYSSADVSEATGANEGASEDALEDIRDPEAEV